MKRREFIRTTVGLGLVAQWAAQGAQAVAGEAKNEKKQVVPYIPFKPINCFTSDRGGKRGVITVQLGLDVTDPKMIDMVNLYVPRLRDAYSTKLETYALTLTKDSVIDMDYLTKQLQLATDQTLKKTGARVLLGSVIAN